MPRYVEDEYRCDHDWFADIADWNINRAIERHSRNDITVSEDAYLSWHFGIKKVIFNAPATIVFWLDGTKTVVKCGPTEMYDSEKGLAMAIAKRALGDTGKYYDTFKKFLPKADEKADWDRWEKRYKDRWETAFKAIFTNKKDEEEE